MKEELQRRVQWYLDQPDQGTRDRTSLLKYYINKQIIEEGKRIIVEGTFQINRKQDPSTILYNVPLEFAVHNTAFEFMDTQNIHYSFMVPEKNYKLHKALDDPHPTLLPDGTWLLQTFYFLRSLPQGWEFRRIAFGWESVDRELPMLLRISSGNSLTDIPFRLFFSD